MVWKIGGGIGQLLPERIARLRKPRMRVDYRADGFGVRKKNLGFFDDPAFARAWAESSRLNAEGWQKLKGGVPDIRWRAHVCCWAAQHGLSLDGDFVECGVHTGILSLVVCHYLDLTKTRKKFWLFDTYEGIPLDGLEGTDRRQAEYANTEIYFDVWAIAQRNFSTFDCARLVRGVLPESLTGADCDRIAFLSIDLNNARAEKSTIDVLWPKLVPGALVVIDDYAFKGHERQYEMWNNFAREVGKMVLTLPTGQGLLIK